MVKITVSSFKCKIRFYLSMCFKEKCIFKQVHCLSGMDSQQKCVFCDYYNHNYMYYSMYCCLYLDICKLNYGRISAQFTHKTAFH